MFDDKRSRKVVLVAHCILNQNARISGCGYFPGAMVEAAGTLVESGVGVLQLPCPELQYLGLDRTGHQGREIGIREALSTPEGQRACEEMLENVVHQIREYQKHGFEVIGVVGIDGSPACGVNITWDHKQRKEIEGTGGFIRALRDVFARNDLRIEIIGVKDHEWEEGVRRIRSLLGDAS